MTITRARMLVCNSATMGVRRTADTELGFVGFVAVGREFPTVHVDVDVDVDGAAATPMPTIDAGEWCDRRNDFAPFDAHVEDLARRGPVTLVVRGDAADCARLTLEMLTRWQRLVDRRNAGSSTPEFCRLLRQHRALHDLAKPRVRADWNHALDTWQWMLRLEASASAAVQMAALLHDVERLETEAEDRVEHLAPSYVLFKKEEHAAKGARMARAVLDVCEVDRPTIERVARLVAQPEGADDDPERALLDDADALSFFSQSSAGYLDYFGPEQTRRKIAFTLGKMREAARARLSTVRLRADVARLVDESGMRGPAIDLQAAPGPVSA